GDLVGGTTVGRPVDRQQHPRPLRPSLHFARRPGRVRVVAAGGAGGVEVAERSGATRADGVGHRQPTPHLVGHRRVGDPVEQVEERDGGQRRGVRGDVVQRQLLAHAATTRASWWSSRTSTAAQASATRAATAPSGVVAANRELSVGWVRTRTQPTTVLSARASQLLALVSFSSTRYPSIVGPFRVGFGWGGSAVESSPAHGADTPGDGLFVLQRPGADTAGADETTVGGEGGVAVGNDASQDVDGVAVVGLAGTLS